jgi:hypothetical protein
MTVVDDAFTQPDRTPQPDAPDSPPAQDDTDDELVLRLGSSGLSGFYSQQGE